MSFAYVLPNLPIKKSNNIGTINDVEGILAAIWAHWIAKVSEAIM